MKKRIILPVLLIISFLVTMIFVVPAMLDTGNNGEFLNNETGKIKWKEMFPYVLVWSSLFFIFLTLIYYLLGSIIKKFGRNISNKNE